MVYYQCFLLDNDAQKQRDRFSRGPWIPISDIYWGQGYHSQLLAHVDDISRVRVRHTA